ncbi:MAG: tryptophanase [candidate division Zixibacteria bacterium]|nr:tryptophanase [candidate division Zixibacteria bacterium]
MKKRHQPAEPYRIKSVESIRLLNRQERESIIARARYNLFRVDADEIYIDLLTDSGTAAMSNRQWAALMIGDESYAGAASFRRFEKTVRDIFRKEFVVPCHQGRSAENMLFSTIVREGDYVPNNTHFDTTRANAQHKKGIPVDFPSPDLESAEARPFMGNMDTVRLEEFIRTQGADRIPVVIMTITNNSVGGQPVSMKNIREVSDICRRHGIPFFFDCARFAENAYFIKRDEPGYSEKSIEYIVGEMFDTCDGVMMSAKKDGLGNIGGFIALNDAELYRKLTELMIIIEGYPTYGGLAGRDLDVLSVGLREVMDFAYLDFRIEQVAYFGELIKQAGIPIIEPTGGHAVFADAGLFLPHILPEQFPAQSLAVAFYTEGGVRAVEIGSLMFGGVEPGTGRQVRARKELVRMALPRRVYTNSHLEYVADIACRINARKESLPGYKITSQPALLRHFTCELEPVQPRGVNVNS